MKNLMSVAMLTLTLLTLGSPVSAQSLLGSRASMERQNQEAVSYGYTFLSTPQAVTTFVNEGHLVRVEDSQHFELHDVSYPYSRPEVKMFIERFSSQYYATCKERLVITSLTRPIDEQPANAASDSVHPTGMAVDMHVPSSPRCRSWLEHTLLSMEGKGLLDVTRERHPAHYHVAVFTRTYENYIAATSRPAPSLSPVAATNPVDSEAAAPDAGINTYIVRKGDTLASIADRTGTTATSLKAVNRLRGNKVKAGRKLQIPAGISAAENVAATVATVATNKGSKAMLASAQVHGKENTVASSELTHRVKRGETLWRIANRYRTTAEMIKQENGLKHDVLNPGQVLRIRSTTARNSLASNNS